MDHADPSVEIHPAYFWTCDSCGRDNFEYSIAFDQRDVIAGLTGKEIMALDDAGVLRGGWYSYPDRVACRGCGSEFRTVAAGGGDDE